MACEVVTVCCPNVHGSKIPRNSVRSRSLHLFDLEDSIVDLSQAFLSQGCSLRAPRDFVLAKIELENRRLASLCTNVLSNVDVFENFRADSV